jgi:hypothetical protein
MQWTADANGGFSSADREALVLPPIADGPYAFSRVNVAAQQNDPDSLLARIARLLQRRRQHPVFGRGAIEFIDPANPRVLAFIRRSAAGALLIVANLDTETQVAVLPRHAFDALADVTGNAPRAVTGRALGDAPRAALDDATAGALAATDVVSGETVAVLTTGSTTAGGRNVTMAAAADVGSITPVAVALRGSGYCWLQLTRSPRQPPEQSTRDRRSGLLSVRHD